MRFSLPVLAAFVGACLLTPASPASATCMTLCTVELMFEDCTVPADPAVWPVGEPLTVVGSCETCCSPPGGPLTCSESPLTADMLALQSSGQPAGGSFTDLGAACGGTDHLFQLDTTLPEGPYDLLVPDTGGIVLQFAVADAGCSSDADCPTCSVCVGGACKGLGLVICQTDSDCDAGEVCKVNAAAPCANQCVSAQAGCASSEDCPPCHGCLDGQCIPSGLVECTDDSHCDAGETCKTNAAEPCKNACVPALPECVSDADCGTCAVCMAGECMDLGVLVCTTDADCSPGEVCEVSAAAPCTNHCVTATPECTGDDDCPTCSGCVDGECMPSGLVECTDDSHCGPGEHCVLNAAAPCNNACEALPDGPDAGGSDASGGDDVGEADTGEGEDAGQVDAGAGEDAGEPDAGGGDDAANVDAGIGDDATPIGDVGTGDAAGTTDTAGDSGTPGSGAAGSSDGGCSAARGGSTLPFASLALALLLLAFARRVRRGQPL